MKYEDESQESKWNRALDFIINEEYCEHQNEMAAHEGEFFYEYVWIREHIIDHLNTLWKEEHV